MARTYTKEQINQMGPGEKRAALEIDALEAEMESLMTPNNLPSDEEAVVVPEVSKGQEVVEPPAPKEVEEPTEPVKDVDYWKKLAEDKAKEANNWQKRQKDAMQELTPVQQENAKLRKDNADILSKFEAMQSKLDQLLSQREQPRHTSLDDDDSEFEEIYPDIAKKLKAVEERAYKKAVSELDGKLKQSEASREELNKIREAMEKSRHEAMLIQHFNSVKAIHADAERFFAENDLGPAFVEWAKTQPSYRQKVVMNPVSAEPGDVADVISLFKEDTGMTRKVTKPALGDRLAKAMNAPSIAADQAKDPLELTDHEIQNIDSLIARNGSNPKEQERLLAGYERFLINQHKRK